MNITFHLSLTSPVADEDNDLTKVISQGSPCLTAGIDSVAWRDSNPSCERRALLGVYEAPLRSSSQAVTPSGRQSQG